MRRIALFALAVALGVTLGWVSAPDAGAQIGYKSGTSLPLASSTILANDNVEAQWGTGADFSIYFTGSEFVIKDNGVTASATVFLDLDGGSYRRDSGSSGSTVWHLDPPTAGSDGYFWEIDATTTAMDGSDTTGVIRIDPTNANHTGSANLFYGLGIDDITQDAQATESAIHIGTGWDYDLEFTDTSPSVRVAGNSTLAFYENLSTFYTFVGAAGADSAFHRFTAGNSGWYLDRNLVSIAATATAMNGSDDMAMLALDITNGNHTGSNNSLYGLFIDGITADAQASEIAIYIGSNWENAIESAGYMYFEAGGDMRFQPDNTTVLTLDGTSTSTSAKLSDNLDGNTWSLHIDVGAQVFAAGEIGGLIFLDLANNNHTGGTLGGLVIKDMTGDAQAEESHFLLGDGYDYFLSDYSSIALGTATYTTANDKTGNAKSGTLKVYINGTLYHIQLYADS